MTRTIIEAETDVEPDAAAPEGQKRKSIQSVESGMRLLEVLAAAPNSLALREIASAGRMSKSQTHRYLLSFVNTGLVRQSSLNGNYELGPAALQIGLAALRRCQPVAIATEELIALVEEAGFSGMVVVWGSHGPTIVRLEMGRRQVVMSLQVGSAVPVLGSSAGHVFLAYLPRATALEYTREIWKRTNGDNPNSLKTVLAKNEYEVRNAGMATVSGTTIPGLSAASAPILDSQGQISAVISLVAYSDDRLLDNDAAMKALVAASKRASGRLGYQPEAELGSI